MKQETIQFSAAELNLYRRPHPGRLVLDLSLPWLQILVGCAIFIYHPAWWTWLIAVVIIAGGQHGLSLISHEAAHRLIWPQNRRVNDLIATCFFAAPVLLPFNVYRQRHLIHHRLVSRPGDTKSFYLRDLRGWRFLAEVLRGLSGIDYLLQALEALRAGKGDQYEQFQANLRRDQLSIVAAQGVLFLAFTAIDPFYFGVPTYYLMLWLWPVVTVSFLFGKLRSVVEHQPSRARTWSSTETAFFLDTPAPLLRSVKASLWERLLLSKINFHYHAEHHLWPGISYQYLPAVNARLWQGHDPGEPRLINDHVIVFENSYNTALANVLRGK